MGIFKKGHMPPSLICFLYAFMPHCWMRLCPYEIFFIRGKNILFRISSGA
jgi:hypothetical protein